MGFLSGIGDTLFGDDGEAASEAQAKQNESDKRFIAEQADVARSQAMPLMSASEQNRLLGQQAAIDALAAAAPQQIGAFQQGGNNAMAAILGGSMAPMSYSTAHLQQQLPEFTSIQNALGSGFQAPIGSVFENQNPADMFAGMTNAQLLQAAPQIAGLSHGAKEWLPKWGASMLSGDPLQASATSFIDNPAANLEGIMGTGLTGENKAYASELFNILGGGR